LRNKGRAILQRKKRRSPASGGSKKKRDLTLIRGRVRRREKEAIGLNKMGKEGIDS